MRLELKDFDIFTFYSNEDESTVQTDRAQARMCEYLTKLLDTTPRLRLEISRSTCSGLTVSTIFQNLAETYDVLTYTDFKTDGAIVRISRKKEEK